MREPADEELTTAGALGMLAALLVGVLLAPVDEGEEPPRDVAG